MICKQTNQNHPIFFDKFFSVCYLRSRREKEKMKKLFPFTVFLFSFCHFAKGEFEERENLSFRVTAIYKGVGVKLNFLF